MGSTEALGFENGRKVFDVVDELRAAEYRWGISGFALLCQRAREEIEQLRPGAQLLRCLADSPRFAQMTVADALAELASNGQAARVVRS